MGIHRILEKFANDGWLVTLFPRAENGFHAKAEKYCEQIAVFDELSMANAIITLDERIYGENADR